MGLRAFQRIRTPNPLIERLQSSVEASFRPLNASLIVDGNIIEDIRIASGTPRTVNHLLGRAYRGWIIVRTNADSEVWESTPENAKTGLILNASATVTVSLWIF